MVLEQRFVVEVEQVDEDVVRSWILLSGRGRECPHELGFARAAHPGDHLDVPGSLQRPEPLHVRFPVDPGHIPSLSVSKLELF